MTELATALFLLVGATFQLLAAIGLVRMPDLLTRLSASTKAVTLGASGMMAAVAVSFQDLGVTSRALAGVVLFFLTAPVAAHLIARASYIVGTALWDRTVVDDLEGEYDPDDYRLHGAPSGRPDAQFPE